MRILHDQRPQPRYVPVMHQDPNSDEHLYGIVDGDWRRLLGNRNGYSVGNYKPYDPNAPPVGSDGPVIPSNPPPVEQQGIVSYRIVSTRESEDRCTGVCVGVGIGIGVCIAVVVVLALAN